MWIKPYKIVMTCIYCMGSYCACYICRMDVAYSVTSLMVRLIVCPLLRNISRSILRGKLKNVAPLGFVNYSTPNITVSNYPGRFFFFHHEEAVKDKHHFKRNLACLHNLHFRVLIRLCESSLDLLINTNSACNWWPWAFHQEWEGLYVLSYVLNKIYTLY